MTLYMGVIFIRRDWVGARTEGVWGNCVAVSPPLLWGGDWRSETTTPEGAEAPYGERMK